MAITLNGTTGITTPALDSSGPLTSLGIDDNATSTAITINASQNVGIGTSLPANKLDVVGDGVRSVARASTTAGEVIVEAQVSNYWSGIYTGTSLRQSGSTATGTYAGLSNANLGSLIFQNGSAGLIATNGGTPIVLATSNTERMRIDSTGAVTMPYQPAFHMENSTNNAVWSGGNIRANVGNHYNNTTGVFTAPVAGTYFFQIHGQAAFGGYWYGEIRQNGTQRASFYTDETSGYRHASCSLIITLAANDAITAGRISGSVAMNTGGQNGFCGHLIG